MERCNTFIYLFLTNEMASKLCWVSSVVANAVILNAQFLNKKHKVHCSAWQFIPENAWRMRFDRKHLMSGVADPDSNATIMPYEPFSWTRGKWNRFLKRRLDYVDPDSSNRITVPENTRPDPLSPLGYLVDKRLSLIIEEQTEFMDYFVPSQTSMNLFADKIGTQSNLLPYLKDFVPIVHATIHNKQNSVDNKVGSYDLHFFDKAVAVVGLKSVEQSTLNLPHTHYSYFPSHFHGFLIPRDGEDTALDTFADPEAFKQRLKQTSKFERYFLQNSKCIDLPSHILP